MKQEHPRTLEESVALVIEQLSPAGKERLRSLNNEEELQTEIMRVHAGLGRSIRNACGLWSNKAILRSIADSHMQEIRRRLAEDQALSPKGKNSLESELGYFERCRQEDFFHPDDFSGIILRAVWKRLRSDVS